jgi:putative ABC transport system permease protein
VALSGAGDATLENLRVAHRQTWIQRDWPATCSDSPPPLVEVESGLWWHKDSAEPAVALNRDLARLWGVTTGSQLDLFAGDRAIRARVHAVLRIPLAQQIWWSEIILDCRSLSGALYSGAIRIAPERLAQVRPWLRERFPDLLFIDMDDLIRREERTSSNGLRVLRLVGVFACLLAGFLLAAILASQRMFRVAQIAIMRALGASKRAVLVSLAVEYMVRGGIAGFFGGVLGCVGTSLILHSAAGIAEWSLSLPVICVATL